MKKYFLSAFLLSFSLVNAWSQAPGWLWAKNATPIVTGNIANGIATDSSGNVYITGYFADATITFDDYTLYNANDSGGQSNDIFIVKYDPSGNVVWAVRDGGVYDELANGIALDRAGNIYITGNFYAGGAAQGDTAIFGSSILVNDSGNSTEDMFIVKYDNNGNEVWAKRAGGSGDDIGFGLTCDPTGNIYVIGSSQSDSIAFGTFELDTAAMFIVKYDTAGNVLWANRSGGDQGSSGDDLVSSVVTDHSNDVYIAGSFASDSVAFGPFTLYNPNAGTQNAIFLVKYDSQSQALWAKTAVSYPPQYVEDIDEIYSIALDASGNIFSAGPFGSDSVQFGKSTVINSNIGDGIADIFLAKWDSSGNVLWAKSVKSTNANGQIPYSIATDNQGNVYMGGYFDENDTLQFGPSVSIAPLCTASTGNLDVFFAKYDENGSALWAQGATGKSCPSVDICNSVATDRNGNLYVLGYFTGDSLDFGAAVLSQNTGLNSLFIAKLSTTISGINEINAPISSIVIFPNPAKDVFTIRVDADIQNGRIEIFDEIGNKIYGEEINNYSSGYNKSIALSASAGLYFAKVTNGEKQYTGKVVIMP